MVAFGVSTASLMADPLTAGPDDARAAAEAALAVGFTEGSAWVQHLDALEGSGLRIALVEGVMGWANGDPDSARAEADNVVAIASRLGASKILACCLEPDLTDLDRARANLRMSVERAADAGAQVCLEFLPWSGVPDLATAWRLVEPLGDAATILLDTWHWTRQPGGPAPDVLAQIPGARIGCVQISDVAATAGDDIFTETMTGRLLPGQGVVDFPSLRAQLDAIGAAPLLATEIFNPRLITELGVKGAAAAMRDATAAVFE